MQLLLTWVCDITLEQVEPATLVPLVNGCKQVFLVFSDITFVILV
jgi:hypothetical protein